MPPEPRPGSASRALRQAALAMALLAGVQCAAAAEPRSLREHAGDFWDELKTVISEGDTKRMRVEYENDIFYATDSNYTNGLRLTWRAGAREAVKFEGDDQLPWIPPLRFTAGGDKARRALEDIECRQAAQTDEQRAQGRPVCYRTAYNFVFFGHNLYTPSDIRLAPAQVPATERPYAGWAYIGFHRELHASDGRYWRYGLDIGCVGPCAYGRQLQTWVHENITHSPLPNGWAAQVHNEFGAVARFEYATRIWHENLAPFGSTVFGMPLTADVRPHVNAGLGNIQTYAGAGVTARVGWFRSSYDTLRLDTHPLESLARADRPDYAQAAGAPDTDCASGCEPAKPLLRMPEFSASCACMATWWPTTPCCRVASSTVQARSPRRPGP